MEEVEENVDLLQNYAQRIKNFDDKLSDLDFLMKNIDSELHEKSSTFTVDTNNNTNEANFNYLMNVSKGDNTSGFNILYVHKKLVEAERDRLLLKKDFESLVENRRNFDKKFEKLEETVQEITGSMNQLRMTLSTIKDKVTKDTDENIEKKKKFSSIFWNILIPLIVSFLIFSISLTFKSCKDVIFDDIGGGNSSEENYIDIK